MRQAPSARSPFRERALFRLTLYSMPRGFSALIAPQWSEMMPHHIRLSNLKFSTILQLE